MLTRYRSYEIIPASQEIRSTPKGRKHANMKTKCKNGNTVENWYDRRSRNSVCQVLDKDGYQIGDADYSGCKESAKYAKEQAIKANGGRK